MPAQELKEVTSLMSLEVLDATKGLVMAVLAGIGNDNQERSGKGAPAMGLEGMSVNVIGPKMVMEQRGEALVQLWIWQVVVGYNMRELEVREEFCAFWKLYADWWWWQWLWCAVRSGCFGIRSITYLLHFTGNSFCFRWRFGMQFHSM